MITDNGILPRYCTCCKQLKLASNFSMQTAVSSKRYLASTCKQCRVAATKKWMSKPENRARHNKWRREKYAQLKTEREARDKQRGENL